MREREDDDRIDAIAIAKKMSPSTWTVQIETIQKGVPAEGKNKAEDRTRYPSEFGISFPHRRVPVREFTALPLLLKKFHRRSVTLGQRQQQQQQQTSRLVVLVVRNIAVYSSILILINLSRKQTKKQTK